MYQQFYMWQAIRIKTHALLLFFACLTLPQLVGAQSKIDSLERLLLSQDLTSNNRIEVEIDLVNTYLEYAPSKVEALLLQLGNHLIKSGDPQQLFQYNYAKSIHLRHTGNFIEAQQTANTALMIAETSKDSLLFKAKIYNSMGAIADDNSNIKLAIDYHLKALRYAEKYNNPTLLATILASLGRAYLYLSEYNVAKMYLTRAILIKEINNQFDTHLAAYYTNLSNCFDAENTYDSSIYYLDKSIYLHKKYHNDIDMITAYNNKAYTLFLMDKLKEAESTILMAIRIGNTVGEENEMMFPYSTYAEILFAQNRLEEAEKMMKKSIDLSKKYNDLYLAKYNLDLLYNIHLKNSNYKLALEYYTQKSVVLDSINNLRTRKEVEKLALEYETEKKNKAIELLNKEKQISQIELNKSNQLVFAFIITTILLIVVVVLLRSRQQNKMKADTFLAEAKEQEFKQKLADSELQSLRAQMNPHFLFNCLNSINSFIIKNEQEQASEYLSKFSKLIRQVLNNSKSAKVTLTSELETLELYIELESLRFNNKFEYKITVAENVEKDYVEIPPLLIQPYVENSIWHGLMHKKEGVGVLLIDIRQEKNILICTIQDNGIGRAAAAKVKSKSAVKQKSYGMNITQERLNHINHKFKESTNIEVVDLQTDSGDAIGTLVKINIEIEA